MKEKLDVPFSIQTSVDSRILEWARETSHEFAKRISYYRCAMLDVENRFNVLNEEYLLDHGRPPVNNVKTRLKTIPSIQEKVKRKDISFSIAVHIIFFGILLIIILNTGVAAPLLASVLFPVLIVMQGGDKISLLLAIIASILLVFMHKDNLRKAIDKKDVCTTREFAAKISSKTDR